MEIIAVILLIGAIQGWILASMLFLKNPSIANNVLGSVIGLIGLALFLAYLQLASDIPSHTYLIKAGLPLPLLFVPGLYLYLRLLTGTDRSLMPKHLILFLPCLLILMYNVPFYLSETSVKLSYFERVDMEGLMTLPEKLEDLFLNLVVLTFSILSFRVAINYRKRVLESFSELERSKTKWVIFLASSMLILTSLAVLILLLQFSFEGQLSSLVNFITAMGSTAVVYFTSFYTLRHPNVFSEVRNELIKASRPEKASKNKMPNKEVEQERYAIRIREVIEKEELFRNPQFTLSDLSTASMIPEYTLSKVINTKLGTNFYSLINKYRLDDVKVRLLEKKDKSIMESAYTSGFNSKSTFYEAFKKDCGLSPSSFILANKQSGEVRPSGRNASI